jgi:hypothetical protein
VISRPLPPPKPMPNATMKICNCTFGSRSRSTSRMFAMYQPFKQYRIKFVNIHRPSLHFGRAKKPKDVTCWWTVVGLWCCPLHFALCIYVARDVKPPNAVVRYWNPCWASQAKPRKRETTRTFPFESAWW